MSAPFGLHIPFVLAFFLFALIFAAAATAFGRR